ncbi:hypothetical protein CIHG_05018 [Coccidioides immitis H538.4]|uniref:Uncharacterized protein n=3 Tax=Coccidioides immitis TaxID=5501 RepID=A0A0J8QPV5_COCIT|nr:hypothetical protein CIRG_03949 [Coccidioides immitis RMSCC 2394]KMU73388.1 hypothetical protein CISG_03523 [Coccidioides immitis RMSCC 3703]KMU87078.1 hypothetical protein CIHG_05018 [Coccidioides immitis H538.4]
MYTFYGPQPKSHKASYWIPSAYGLAAEISITQPIPTQCRFASQTSGEWKRDALGLENTTTTIPSWSIIKLCGHPDEFTSSSNFGTYAPRRYALEGGTAPSHGLLLGVDNARDSPFNSAASWSGV